MPRLNTYLNFNGNTEEAFNLYKSVFGGEFATVMRFKDIPDAMPEGVELSPEDADKIMHIALPVGDSMLMATDALESMGQSLTVGNNNYISINASSRDEADRFFNGLSEGGKVEMPMTDMFWGDYYGSFADKYGVQWMVSYNEKHA